MLGCVPQWRLKCWPKYLTGLLKWANLGHWRLKATSLGLLGVR
jgi:hypothetical protein